MTKVRISISLCEKLFDELEKQRGLVSRSKFIEFLLRRSIKDEKEEF